MSIFDKAFDLYYSLGDIQAVADRVGRTTKTVSKWRDKFGWDAMIHQRALETAKQAGIEELHRETLTIRAEYRKAMDTLLEQATKDIQEGKIQIESVEDLERVIKLDLLLMGEFTESVERVLYLSMCEEE